MKTKWLWIPVFFVSFVLLTYALLSTPNNYDLTEKFQIGILLSGQERMEKIKGLKEGLHNLGYIEGENVEYIIKDAENSFEIMEEYASQLNKMNLDVIVAGGAIETKYLKETNFAKIPIVFLGVADAVNLNFIESYQKPNGRITGVENAHVELSPKRLQLFKLLLPELERIIVIYDENIEASLLSLDKVKEYALADNIDIYPVSVKDIRQFMSFRTMSFKENDGILVLPSYYLEKISNELAKFALNKKIPIFGVNITDVQNGFLLSYGVSYYDQGYQGAPMVSQILSGINPEGIPVEKPNSIKLLVNSKTKESLNIQFSKVGNAFVNRLNFNN